MSNDQIGKAVASVEDYLRAQDEPAPRADASATAIIEDALCCRIESPDGKVIHTDMPQSLGGGASANSPGWHLRAALASCDATLLAMRAARLGLQLDSIEVRVEASSDGRGMFLDEDIPAGSSEMRLYFRIGAGNATAAQIEDLVHWVERHSPVGSDVTRALDLPSELEIC